MFYTRLSISTNNSNSIKTCFEQQILNFLDEFKLHSLTIAKIFMYCIIEFDCAEENLLPDTYICWSLAQTQAIQF